MTEKLHLTKSRTVSTKFQFQPFITADLYKQVWNYENFQLCELFQLVQFLLLNTSMHSD